METRIRSWALVAALLVITGGVLTGLYLYRGRTSMADYLPRLPSTEAILVKVDVAALRQAGILEQVAGRGGVQETEYLQFVSGTGFNYETDLDEIYASWGFRQSDYYLVKGRFDWTRLREYAKQSGGTCLNAYCSLPASAPSRFISFFPLKEDIMAVGVSRDQDAAYLLLGDLFGLESPFPDVPVWLRVPSDRLSSAEQAMPAARVLLEPLARARYVDLALTGTLTSVNLALEVECYTAGQAEMLAEQMTTISGKLKEIAGQQESGALLRTLASAKFSSSGTEVQGDWNLPFTQLQTLFQGF